jgi:predicted nucleic acid-binding protein
LISRISPELNASTDIQTLEAMRAKEFTFLTSELTRLEISRFLHRLHTNNSSSVSLEKHVRDALAGIELIRLNNRTLEIAARFPFPHLGSLDSIHLASAQMVGATHFLTRDRQLIDAGTQLGIATTF